MSIRKKIRLSYRYECGNLYSTVIKKPMFKSKGAKRRHVITETRIKRNIKKFLEFIGKSGPFPRFFDDSESR